MNKKFQIKNINKRNIHLRFSEMLLEIKKELKEVYRLAEKTLKIDIVTQVGNYLNIEWDYDISNSLDDYKQLLLCYKEVIEVRNKVIKGTVEYSVNGVDDNYGLHKILTFLDNPVENKFSVVDFFNEDKKRNKQPKSIEGLVLSWYEELTNNETSIIQLESIKKHNKQKQKSLFKEFMKLPANSNEKLNLGEDMKNIDFELSAQDKQIQSLKEHSFYAKNIIRTLENASDLLKNGLQEFEAVNSKEIILKLNPKNAFEIINEGHSTLKVALRDLDDSSIIIKENKKNRKDQKVYQENREMDEYTINMLKRLEQEYVGDKAESINEMKNLIPKNEE